MSPLESARLRVRMVEATMRENARDRLVSTAVDVAVFAALAAIVVLTS
jgi:hypothetical protein